ncbi:MAG: hypothetical protein ACREOQ_03875, partial [Gemmatimonadales bacterium]
RALENQIVWLSANQSGQFGSLRFVASAKVVDPGGEILAETGVHPGLAIADLDVQQALDNARRSMAHLRDRRPDAYTSSTVPELNSRAVHDGKNSSAVQFGGLRAGSAQTHHG